ncbi:LPXTG-motif cell wall anchor domain protein [Pseudarthrobacter phenanthrenivorans Sphe3]|uniref:LPXTG-motif cell wall anchor domain protein n=1 Tax=Pseudarthrobacter phenanthrenivorans (strain DSM 18606 / JCM 16027 / LMG 23796 / Sphe3) TaxID=930171 RepID=F0M1I4_PSEPM|nr:LPXTG cell wall anchor domain-containing protein [Pseudarthrobacter phenanthrenivorans]ADX74180.1 LPXTG-motif cell wall anchor domain protein [Pseudarthrobacter phenanthrenivorans Sphe3]
MKKAFAALALAGSIALIGSAPAMAATYPALPPQAAVSDGVVGPGEDFIFSGQGFLAGETLTITVTPGDAPASDGASIAGGTAVVGKISLYMAPSTLTTTADAQGKFSLPISISEPGTYSITATGNTSGVVVGPVSVTVMASLANTGGAPLANTGAGLANTGADSGLVLWTLVGAGALAAGATSVVVVRRRAKAEAAA